MVFESFRPIAPFILNVNVRLSILYTIFFWSGKTFLKTAPTIISTAKIMILLRKDAINNQKKKGLSETML